jgi:hypothetical protein
MSAVDPACPTATDDAPAALAQVVSLRPLAAAWQGVRDPRPRTAARRPDLFALADDLLADGSAGQRTGPALLLAATLVSGYPATPLPAALLRRLDAALPGLLESSPPRDLRALVALCAALSDRLSSAVRGPLRALATHADASLAVSAHLTTLLLEGMSLSESHLVDLAAVAGADAVALVTPRRHSTRVRAMLLAQALADGQRLAC